MVFANSARSHVRLAMVKQIDVLPVLMIVSFTKVHVWTTAQKNTSQITQLSINASSLVSSAQPASTSILLVKVAFPMIFSVLKGMRLMKLRLLVSQLQARQYLSHSSS
jgi:hypothetical protein